jgi:hypothetical protein
MGCPNSTVDIHDTLACAMCYVITYRKSPSEFVRTPAVYREPFTKLPNSQLVDLLEMAKVMGIDLTKFQGTAHLRQQAKSYIGRGGCDGGYTVVNVVLVLRISRFDCQF